MKKGLLILILALGALFVCHREASADCMPWNYSCPPSTNPDLRHLCIDLNNFSYCCSEHEHECLPCNDACQRINPSYSSNCVANTWCRDYFQGDSIGVTQDCNFIDHTCCCYLIASPTPYQSLTPTIPEGLLCNGDLGINTAIGCIPTSNINAFAGFFLPWAIGIGGGISFLLILLSGFIITTSAGNPDKVKAGKELLTAAVSGLLLIIFSVFILELFGVRIFRLPGL